jgi:hypothetical protein
LYWAGRLGEIHAAVERAAANEPARVGLAGLRGIGERRSWYGVAEIRGGEVIHASMAHATSLGRVIAASGICANLPAATFRFVVSAAGDTLTVSVATGGPAHPPTMTAVRGERAGAARAAGAFGTHHVRPATASGPLPDVRSREPAGSAAERFYQAMGQLAEIVGGPRLLRECHGSDGWPPQGVYFFFEPGEVRADRSGLLSLGHQVSVVRIPVQQGHSSVISARAGLQQGGGLEAAAGADSTYGQGAPFTVMLTVLPLMLPVKGTD